MLIITAFTGFYPHQSENENHKLLSAAFLGGSNFDDAYEPSIAFDADGALLISGFTLSTDFPVTENIYSNKFIGGQTDRFISLISNDLAQLKASTYMGSKGTSFGFVGGNGDDLGHAVAVDKDGNVFIAGYTESANYPVTTSAYDASYNGGRDVFISKFDKDLKTLSASTFIGGSGDEGYMWPRIDMTVNADGDVIVSGITHSVDFPITSGAFSGKFNGGEQSGDAFIVILDNNLSKLKASTYLGGSNNEWRVAVHALKNGSVLVCGETESDDFPTSRQAYDRTLNVIKDVFISRFDSRLRRLEASTLFGGSKLDEALDMDVSDNGEIYITGYTESQDLPVTSGSFNQAWSGGNREGYAAKFDKDLSTLICSTFFGGSGVDFPRGIALDEDGDVYITGNTTSKDFPLTEGAYSSVYTGGRFRGDVFLVKFTGKLDKLDYSTLIGGNSEDTGFCIDLDKNGNIFIAGSTSSKDFPMPTNSFDNTYNGGGNDTFILKFSGKSAKR